MKRFVLIVIGVTLAAVCHAAEKMTSPDGRVSAHLFLNEDGELRYNVTFKTTPVVEPSALGITVDGIQLGAGVRLGQAGASIVDETYPTRGNHRWARNHYKGWQFPVEHRDSGRGYSLQFRMYNDGVAYRYIVPGQGWQHVGGEHSSWTMVNTSQTWFFERNSHWKLMSYAGLWTHADIDEMPTISSQGPVQGTPLVFELPERLGYAAITKAALYHYSGMRLRAVGQRRFVADFTEGDKGFDVEGTIVTPWRVTLLADSLNALVNSDLIENLNPAPDAELFADSRYIQPGRSVWSWMSMRLGTIQDQIDFVDQAAELGFEYSLIDDGWKDWLNPWQTVAAIAARGENKGVKVWVWVDSKDISDPKDDYQQMRAYLDKVKAAGVCGVKTDFMNSEAKIWIDFEIRFLQRSAERQLLVNFHGCHASTGEARTYPNELTREGIRGIEVNLHKNGHLPPSHNAALPFTRLLLGHGDYTPLYYTNPGPTTYAHQLATPIVFYSPLQVYADHPHVLQNNPYMVPGLRVLKAIPTTWDETCVLDGSTIGQLAAFARRSGDTWFVGILNGESATAYDLDLSFLPDGEYQAELVEDDQSSPVIQLAGLNKIAKGKLDIFTTAIPFKISRIRVTRLTHLTVKLARGGGLVVMLTKE
jgi:alpha-glucosidase